jgi:hypothetical protein
MQDCSEDSLHEKSGKDNIILPEELTQCSIFPSNPDIDSEAQLDLQSEKRLLHFLQMHNSSMILKFVQLWKFSFACNPSHILSFATEIAWKIRDKNDPSGTGLVRIVRLSNRLQEETDCLLLLTQSPNPLHLHNETTIWTHMSA